MQSAYNQKFQLEYLICCPKSRYIFTNLVGAFEARQSSSFSSIGLYEIARISLFAGRCENFFAGSQSDRKAATIQRRVKLSPEAGGAITPYIASMRAASYSSERHTDKKILDRSF
jgi:hypothetical protein